tara:strand:+ start:42 stop:1682 length:1641 start_codon:yes stop_codon:yes gene_type:complete
MAVEKTINITVNTKKAEKGVKKLGNDIGDVGKSAGGAEKGLKGMTGGTKALGAGFKALGIGLIISAFMKLKDLFSGNIETARKFEVAAAKISAMFDVLRDRIEPLFMSLSKLFTDPLGSLETFANAIKENMINRVKGLIDMFGALGKVVKGVFTRDMDLLKEGAGEASTAFTQLSTGLDEIQQKKIADEFKSITKEINEETKAVGKLTVALQNVRDRERDMLTVRADANKLIAESRLLAEDESKSMEERLVALKAAVDEEQRVAAIEMSIQQDKVNALQEIIDLGKSSEEDMQNLAAERARLTELETASILKQKRVVTEIVTFEKQIETEKNKIAKAELDRQNLLLQAKELNLEITEELSNKEIAALIKVEEKKLAIERKAAADKLKITQDKIAMNKAMELTGAKMILGALGQLAGEGTALAKATAVSSILINTAQGVSAAIKAGAGLVFPANLGAIATGVGAVLSGIASAKNILSQVPGGGDSGSTPTPDITTPTGIGAGGLIPNLEAIDAVQLGGATPVQAFVVENDISNAQALQEELEIQATL